MSTMTVTTQDQPAQTPAPLCASKIRDALAQINQRLVALDYAVERPIAERQSERRRLVALHRHLTAQLPA